MRLLGLNSWKKKSKLILGLISTFLVLIVFITTLIITLKKPKKIFVTTVPKSYSVELNQEEKLLAFNIYTTVKDSFLTDKKMVEMASLKSHDFELSVSLKQITLLDKLEFNKTFLYAYEMVFTIPLVSEALKLNDAKVTIKYHNDKTVTYPVGEVYFYNSLRDTSKLTPTFVKGVTEFKNGKNELVGVYLAFGNSSKTLLKNIEVFSPFFNVGKLKEVETIKNFDTPFEEIYKMPYAKETRFSETEVLDGKKYFLPLYYKGTRHIENLTVVFTYFEEGVLKSSSLKNFTFFSDKNYEIPLENLQFQEVVR